MPRGFCRECDRLASIADGYCRVCGSVDVDWSPVWEEAGLVACKGLALNPTVPERILESLAAHESPRVRAEVAKNPFASDELLAKMMLNGNKAVSFIARSTLELRGMEAELDCQRLDAQSRMAFESKSAETLRTLAYRDYDGIRPIVALNPFTPRDVLAALAQDRDAQTRAAVAANEQSHPGVLATLLHDENEAVRVCAAQNPSLQLEALSQLVKSDDEILRQSALHNPCLPYEILSDVVEEAAKHCPGEFIVECIARNRALCVYGLSHLAESDIPSVRAGVADNEMTPPEVLARLAQDRHWYVRMKVAGHPSAPKDVFEALLEDSDEQVLCALAGNPSLPHQAKEKLATHPLSAVRETLASGFGTPPDVLEVLLDDEDEQVRQAAYAHIPWAFVAARLSSQSYG